MPTLKQKTISALSWSFAGNFAGKAIGFIFGIILARLLSPREYGLIGMVTVFTILTEPFINSGFSQALIRKKKCTETEFSTVFYFNLLTGIFFYAIIFLGAPYISKFFNEPELTRITRIIGIIIIIDAVTIIQTTLIIRNVNFKLQTKIDLSSSIISGILGVFLAYRGFGVWSLVYRTITLQFLRSLFLWITNRWMPKIEFSATTLRELFGFSSKILISAILDKIYFNIYNFVIAKYFSAKELGLFTRAQMFKDMVAVNLSEITAKVSFPVLASIQDEPTRIKDNYKKFYTTINYVVWVSLFILAAIAESLVLVLIGDQWKGAVVYLQLLCFVGVFYPTHALTRNILYVYGKSSLALKLQVLSKTMMIPVILTGIFGGIQKMIIVLILGSLIETIAKSYYSGKLVNYPLKAQLNDIISTILISLTIGVSLFVIKMLLETTPFFTLMIQLSIGAFLTVALSELFKIKEYFILKEVASTQFNVFLKRIKQQ